MVLSKGRVVFYIRTVKIFLKIGFFGVFKII